VAEDPKPENKTAGDRGRKSPRLPLGDRIKGRSSHECLVWDKGRAGTDIEPRGNCEHSSKKPKQRRGSDKKALDSYSEKEIQKQRKDRRPKSKKKKKKKKKKTKQTRKQKKKKTKKPNEDQWKGIHLRPPQKTQRGSFQTAPQRQRG